MRRPGRRARLAAVILTGLFLALGPSAAAHVQTASGPLRVTMGWGREPALTGAENFVQVAVSDASGAPVAARGARLTVEVSFGDTRISLPLLPARTPGEFEAVLVPTRPGTYGFHVTGTVQGRAADVRATCSDRTFDCVTPASEVQFPVRDPSTGDVVRRLERELSRVHRAADRADTARNLALGALVLAALALAAALGLGVRRRRRGG